MDLADSSKAVLSIITSLWKKEIGLGNSWISKKCEMSINSGSRYRQRELKRGED